MGSLSELTITEEGLNNSAAKLVKRGDILYALYGATSGEVSISRLDGAINQAILAIKPCIGYDSYLLMSLLKNEKKKIREKFLQGGQGNLSARIVKNIKLDIPSINEQTKIGCLLLQLDRTITLHEEKEHQLEQLKSALLQKMFADKSGYPAVRFEGFDEVWKHQKFSDIVKGLQNNTLSRSELNYECGTVKNIHYGDILTKFGEFIDASKTSLPYISDNTKADKFEKSFLKDGDIVIADTAEDDTVGKCVEIQGSEHLKISAGLHTIACRPKQQYGSKYLGYYFNSPVYHNQLHPLMQGIKVTSISKSSIQNTDVYIPQSVAEQSKIGDVLSKIDSLISLNQREVKKLSIIKQSLLQKMFI